MSASLFMLPSRILEKIALEPLSGCWIWTAQTVRGYGRIRMGPLTRIAHRAIYELLVGPIPRGLQCDHICRHPNCVNPEHIRIVSARENTLEARSQSRTAINFRKTHCLRGHALTSENVRLINGRFRQCRACDQLRHDAAPRKTARRVRR